MFATKRSSEAASAEANRLIYEMEQKFDLMRLKARRADLEREEARLAEEEKHLRWPEPAEELYRPAVRNTHGDHWGTKAMMRWCSRSVSGRCGLPDDSASAKQQVVDCRYPVHRRDETLR
jgi:hypothetical protein